MIASWRRHYKCITDATGCGLHHLDDPEARTWMARAGVPH